MTVMVNDESTHRKALQKINLLVKGKQKLEGGTVDTILATSTNKRDSLCSLALDLYTLCKKILDDTSLHAPADKPTENLSEVVSEQLKKILPEALKEALSVLKVTATEDIKDEIPEPVEKKHFLDVEINGSEEESEEDKKSVTDEEWAELQTKVRRNLKDVPVKKMSRNGGKVSLLLPDKESLDKAATALRDDYKVSPTTKDKRKLNPKIRITDIDTEITTDKDLIEEIYNKNKVLRDLRDSGDSLKVILYRKEDKIAVVEVSPAMRSAIKKNQDKIYLACQIHRVKDHIHVIQCFRCQEHGHTSTSKYCKLKGKDSVCFRCAGKHPSKQCPNRGNQKCANCLKSKISFIRDQAGTHNATDYLCPFVIRETESVMSRTAGYTVVKNEYVQKIKQLKRTQRR